MSTSQSTVTITEGFPVDDPWVITGTDEYVVNNAVATLAGLASSQGALLQTQTRKLEEQVQVIDALKDKVAALSADYLVPLAQDASGTPLLTDARFISDLVGKKIENLAATDVERLITFTTALTNNVPPVDFTVGDVFKAEDPGSINPNPFGNTQTYYLRYGVFEAVYLREGADGFNLSNYEMQRLYRDADVNPIQDGAFKLRIPTNGDPPNDVRDISYPKERIALVSDPSPQVQWDGVQVTLSDSNNRPIVVSGKLNTFYDDSLPDNLPAAPVGSYYFTRSAKENTSPFVSEKVDEILVYQRTASGYERVPESRISEIKGFVIPESESELTNWLGRASAARLDATLDQAKTDGVEFSLENKTTVKWTSTLSSSVGYANLPPVSATSWSAMESDATIKTGDLVKLVELRAGELQPTTTYYVKAGTYKNDAGTVTKNWFVEVAVDESQAFQLIPTARDAINLRGAYSEKILQLSQRSAEQQLFLTQVVNKYNSLFDAATYVLKALTDLYRRIVPS